MAKTGTPTELGTQPIGKLLLQYAIPAIIAMTASSLYNMVDSIFIGHGVGPLAISGLAITFPLMNLAAAFGSLVGVGASGYHLLCTRLHGHYPAGQCYNPHVFGTECLTTRFGASTKSNDSHHHHSNYQYHP